MTDEKSRASFFGKPETSGQVGVYNNVLPSFSCCNVLRVDNCFQGTAQNFVLVMIITVTITIVCERGYHIVTCSDLLCGTLKFQCPLKLLRRLRRYDRSIEAYPSHHLMLGLVDCPHLTTVIPPPSSSYTKPKPHLTTIIPPLLINTTPKPHLTTVLPPPPHPY